MQHCLIGFMRYRYLAFATALFAIVGCGQSSPTDDGLCGGQVCRAGEFCISGMCEQLCSAEGTCSAGFSCRDGICVPVACGDGQVEGAEECDEGVDNDDNGVCTRRCENARCGDGLELYGSEECDDSNAMMATQTIQTAVVPIAFSPCVMPQRPMGLRALTTVFSAMAQRFVREVSAYRVAHLVSRTV